MILLSFLVEVNVILELFRKLLALPWTDGMMCPMWVQETGTGQHEFFMIPQTFSTASMHGGITVMLRATNSDTHFTNGPSRVAESETNGSRPRREMPRPTLPMKPRPPLLIQPKKAATRELPPMFRRSREPQTRVIQPSQPIWWRHSTARPILLNEKCLPACWMNALDGYATDLVMPLLF